MHKLTNWKARRSGPRVTVSGRHPDGREAKISAIEIAGPCEYRFSLPESTVAILPGGAVVELV